MSHNMHTNAALHPIYPPPPTALPLDWDEELPEIIQNLRRRGGFDLLSCKPNTGNVLIPRFKYLFYDLPATFTHPLTLLAYTLLRSLHSSLHMAEVTYNSSSFPAFLRDGRKDTLQSAG